MNVLPAMQQAAALADIPAREKRAVALSSVLAAVLLTTLKIVVGLLTGSLGILAEAAHSGLDLVAALVTYISVRLSDRPADSSHPFGHGKIEHLSAFIETALLLITCLWIVWEAGRRLLFREVHVDPSVWAFGVMLVSITMDTFRSRALFRVARKYNSQALEADALHFSTDIYSSSVVVLGLLLIYVAEQKHIPMLRRADPLAALGVAAIVVYLSLRLGKRTVDALVDAAPAGTTARIERAVANVPGVLNPDRIRVRQSGNRLFVDVLLTLEGNIPFEHAESIVNLVETKIHELFPTADVMINATPRKPSSEDLLERIRAVAHREKFLIHEVAAYEVGGTVHVHLDLEVDPALTFDSAHEQATRLEHHLKEGLPELGQVYIHIEPLERGVETGGTARLDESEVNRVLTGVVRETPGLIDCHAVNAHQVGGIMVVGLHCTLDPQLPMSRVHEITELLEFRLRQAFPQVSQVNIHPEPKGKN
jgi:cation diffusion facilitator family transporter